MSFIENLRGLHNFIKHPKVLKCLILNTNTIKKKKMSFLNFIQSKEIYFSKSK